MPLLHSYIYSQSTIISSIGTLMKCGMDKQTLRWVESCLDYEVQETREGARSLAAVCQRCPLRVHKLNYRKFLYTSIFIYIDIFNFHTIKQLLLNLSTSELFLKVVQPGEVSHILLECVSTLVGCLSLQSYQ